MTEGDSTPHPYVLAWRGFAAERRPHVLPGDEALLENSTGYTDFRSAAQFQSAMTAPRDARFHLGLLPQPFHGPLEDASAYVLMLNPGFDPRDYFWDYEQPAFRAALIEQYGGQSSFLFLDDRFRDHPGHRWWWGKAQLRRLAEAMAHQTGISLAIAIQQLARRIAAIELMPYHSKSYDPKLLSGTKLASVALARSFVHEHVLPRARSGHAALVVARGNQAWGLAEEPNVVVYSGAEPVSARVGPGSRGGDLILHHLLRGST
jgi:hypothetical protein